MIRGTSSPGLSLDESQLLPRRLGSTVPGLVQVGDRRAREPRRLPPQRRRQLRAATNTQSRISPNTVWRSASSCLPTTLRPSLQRVDRRIPMRPWISERDRRVRANHAADVVELEQARAFGDEQPDQRVAPARRARPGRASSAASSSQYPSSVVQGVNATNVGTSVRPGGAAARRDLARSRARVCPFSRCASTPIVDRLHRGRDEQAAGVAQHAAAIGVRERGVRS